MGISVRVRVPMPAKHSSPFAPETKKAAQFALSGECGEGGITFSLLENRPPTSARSVRRRAFCIVRRQPKSVRVLPHLSEQIRPSAPSAIVLIAAWSNSDAVHAKFPARSPAALLQQFLRQSVLTDPRHN